MLFAGLAHLVRPDAGLYLSDVSLAQEEHAKSALPDAASDAERERVVHQSFVEIQIQPFFLTRFLELSQKGRLVHTNTH